MTRIKIKKGRPDKVSEDLKVDLRNQPREIKQPLNKWLFLSIFLIMVILVLSGSWYVFYFKKSSLIDLVPEQAVIYSLINQQAFYEHGSNLTQFLKQRNVYNKLAIDKISSYLNQANLSFEQDFGPLFEKEIAFVLMPANSETILPFLLIFEGKKPLRELKQTLDKIELEARNDYNLSFQTYRNNEITILEPLSSSLVSGSYVYAQIKNYFVISNSKQVLSIIIDLVINN